MTAGMKINCLTEFVVEACYKCHMLFAVPEKTQARYLKTHESFYCPSGHSQSYQGETEETKLRKKLKQTQGDRDWWEGQHDKEVKLHQSTEARRRAQKGVATKIKNRIANGVCPCCNRTFRDLQRHMKSKHPDFAEPMTSTSND